MEYLLKVSLNSIKKMASVHENSFVHTSNVCIKANFSISPAKAFIFMKQFGSCVNIVPQIQIFRGTGGQGLLGFPSQQLKSEGSGNSQIIRARSTPTILLPFHPHRCFAGFVLCLFSLFLSFSLNSNANFACNQESSA